MMKQSEAVFQAVTSVFTEVEGAVPETSKWTSEQKSAVYVERFSVGDYIFTPLSEGI
jgi:5-hydroxyisourate hydrolase-like protein (transthyretin family)